MVDLVLYDDLSDVTSLHNEYIKRQLLLSTVDIPTHCLEHVSTFVLKTFRVVICRF